MPIGAAAGEQREVHLRVRVLKGFWERLRGLIGEPPPAPQEAVWLPNCRQIRTLAMRYPIDVVHIDRRGRVLAVAQIKPWRLGRWHAQASGVLEMRAGVAAALGFGVGMTVHWRLKGSQWHIAIESNPRVAETQA